MKTTDKNKLIAEFMDVPQGNHTHFMIEPFALESYADVDDLKYDISWDWLMPIVVKLLTLDTFAEFKGSNDYIFKLNDALLGANIDSLYNATCDCVIHYYYNLP